MVRSLILLLALASLLASASASAHKASDSFLYVDADRKGAQPTARLDIALADLTRMLLLDRNQDGQVTWGELEEAMAGVRRELAARVRFQRGETPCPSRWSAQGITQHSDGNYLSLAVSTACPTGAVGRNSLEYSLFFEQDPLHRLLVMVREDGVERLTVAGPSQRTVDLESAPSAWQTVQSFVREGMIHLWIGYDHMLFLLALILPAAVRRERGRWVVEDRIGTALKEVALIVTAFTVAHSATLVIATLGLVTFDIQWVETLIALSIVAAAINVVWPFLGSRRYLMGFGFGLIHGFGFAGVLSDFMADTSQRALALASFNVGVELAQLTVVAIAVPLIFLVRRHWAYRHVVLPSGVAAIVLTGTFWAFERAPI